MKKLKMNKTTVAMLMAMSTLYGCGGGADDPKEILTWLCKATLALVSTVHLK